MATRRKQTGLAQNPVASLPVANSQSLQRRQANEDVLGQSLQVGVLDRTTNQATESNSDKRDGVGQAVILLYNTLFGIT